MNLLQLLLKVTFMTLALCNFVECVNQDDVRHEGCPIPPPLSKGTYTTGLKGDYQPGDVVKWTCDVIRADQQYSEEEVPNGSLICSSNLTWSKPYPDCGCFHPGTIQHGGYIFQNGSEYTNGKVTIGTTLGVVCTNGYLPLHRNNTCLPTGQWEFHGTCKLSCPKVIVRNGYYNFSAKEIPPYYFFRSYYLPGTTVKLVCLEGFRALGEDELVCDNSGNWSGFPRKCVPTCRVPLVPNGKFVDEKGLPLEHFDSGQSARLICDVGYDVTPAGNRTADRHDTIQCMNHTWTGTLIICAASTPDVEVTGDNVQGRQIAMILGGSIGGLLLIVSTLVFAFRRRILGNRDTCEGTHTISDQGYLHPMTGNADDKMQTFERGIPHPMAGKVDENMKTLGQGIQLTVAGHAGETNTYVNADQGPIYDNATFATHSVDGYEQPTPEHDSEEYMYARLQSDKDM